MRKLAIAGILLIALLGTTLTAENRAVIPAWVRPGLVVTYDSVSAFVNQYGQFSQGVRIIMTTRVKSVSDGRVFGSTHIQTVGSPIEGTHEWSCNAAADCIKDETGLHGKFWVDPDHPTDSVKGPFGEIFSVVGKAPYSRNGHDWNAMMLTYKNPDTRVAYDITYEEKTGLILASSEINPGQQVHAYFVSMAGQ